MRTFIKFFEYVFVCLLAIYSTQSFAQTLNQSASKSNSVSTIQKYPSSSPSQKPLWKDLTPPQQQALSPLAAEWDTLSIAKKRKWLTVIKKFPTLKPEEQNRIQERMREWVKLTPEQRRTARENYTRTQKINTHQKSTKWQQYQQLPEEQKKQLAIHAGPQKQMAPNTKTPIQVAP